MGSKVKGPGIAGSIADQGPHHAKYQPWLVAQKQGNGRITDIRRGGASIGETFLGDKQQPALWVLAQSVASNYLPVSQQQQLGIPLSPSVNRLLPQLV